MGSILKKILPKVKRNGSKFEMIFLGQSNRLFSIKPSSEQMLSYTYIINQQINILFYRTSTSNQTKPL